jgi:hypothetical protein
MSEVLSLVERGWRGARACSLALHERGVAVTHLIRGSVSRDVLAMIQPYPLIRLEAAPRPLFRLRAWAALFMGTLTERTRWLLVDNDRRLREVARWCRWFGITPVRIRETEDGFQLSVDGRAAPLEAAFRR